MEGLSDKEKARRPVPGRSKAGQRSWALQTTVCALEKGSPSPQRRKDGELGSRFQETHVRKGSFLLGVEILRISRMKCKDLINHE